MSGDREQKCLDFVRKKFGIENCYALSQDDYEKIEACLASATPNPRPSDFPDFVFTNGFIEHFQISSSSENRRGSTHIKEKSAFDRKTEHEEAEFRASLANTQSEVRGINSIFNYPEHSYENLVSSFKTHWEEHLNSLEKKPEYKRKCGIFMIQYCDMALEMFEDIFQNSKEGLSLYIRDPQHFYDYRLSRDKALLEYIARHKETVQYVIYVNSQEAEIISTANAMEIIKLLPWDFRIASPKCQIMRRALYGISIPTVEGEVQADE